MRNRIIALCGLLSLLIAGCSSHQPKKTGANEWRVTGRSGAVASVEDFEKQALKVCPFGYEIVGPPRSFNKDEEETRVIRCKMVGGGDVRRVKSR